MPTINGYELPNPVEQLGLDRSKLMTIAEAAGLLRLSQAMIYALVRRGELVGLRFGSAVRVRECDVIAYIHRSLTRQDED